MGIAIIVAWSLWMVNLGIHGVQQHRVEKAEAQAQLAKNK